MIALAGTIGTGLFLGSGKAIVNGGPLGAFLGYLFVGILVTGPVFSIAEMSALVPLSGGIIRVAEYFFDPALGFANGWNSIYSSMMSLPAEITAAAVIVDFWTTDVNNGIWITIFGLLVFLANIFLVRVYGELEFSFAILKILLIFGLNLMALVLVCGGGPSGVVYGFKYWHNPGPFVQYLGIKGGLGNFLGFWTTFSNAVYAYSGLCCVNTPHLADELSYVRCGNHFCCSSRDLGTTTQHPHCGETHLLESLDFLCDFHLFRGYAGTIERFSPALLDWHRRTVTFCHCCHECRSQSGSQHHQCSRLDFSLECRQFGPASQLSYSLWAGPRRARTVVLHSGQSLGCSLDLRRLHEPLDLSGFHESNKWCLDGVRLVSKPGICRGTRELDRHLLCVPAILLCDEEARNPERASALESPFPAIRCLDGLHLVHTSLAYRRVCDFYTWPVSPFLFHLHTPMVLTVRRWDTETFISAYLDIPIILIFYFGFKLIKKTKIVPLDEVPIMKYIEIAERNPEPPAMPKIGWRRFNILWS